MTWGVDYASVDGNHPPDLDAFKRAGGSFVWLRCSYGEYLTHGAWRIVPDPTFARDWAALAAAGLVRGAYIGPAVMASHSPEEQVGVAFAAVQAAGGLRKGVDFPPCLDVEFPQGIKGTGMTPSQIVDWVHRAALHVYKLWDVWPIIYTSGRVWNDTDADCLGDPPAPADLLACPLWLARYAYATRQPAVLPPPEGPAPPVPTPWGDEWHAHQDQGDALHVPGFSATVDVDRFRPAKLGDHGGHVAWYQRKRALVADGVFGPATDADVRRLQTIWGLTVDGILGVHAFCAAAWL